MNTLSAVRLDRATSVRFGVLAFMCGLSMITYLDRVCFGTVARYIQPEFNLTNTQMGLLFSAFAFAYAVFEVPTGWLGDVFGARKTLIRIVLWWSLFTALTGAIFPSSAYPLVSFYTLVAVRFLFGVGEAGAYPNISSAFSHWFPFSERGMAQGAVWMAGRFAGGLSPLVVMAMVYSVAGPEGESVTKWRHLFWIFGGIGVLWCIAFWFWFRDRPSEHTSVNPAELSLIRGGQIKSPERIEDRPGQVTSSTAIQTGTNSPDSIQPNPNRLSPTQENSFATTRSDYPDGPGAPLGHSDHSPTNVPWGKLLTNLNLWTLCLMYFGCAYGWYFNITWLPKFLEKQYHVTSESHGVWGFGLLAGAPLLLGSLACLMGGLLTDAFIRHTGNRKWGRRLFGAIGHSVCAVFYFLTLTAESPYVFVAYIALAAFWNDLTMGSAWASCIDIGGRYSGIVSGCMNTIGNLGGAVAGITTGAILDIFGQETGWTINFVSFGMVYVLAVFLWLRFDATRKVIPTA